MDFGDDSVAGVGQPKWNTAVFGTFEHLVLVLQEDVKFLRGCFGFADDRIGRPAMGARGSVGTGIRLFVKERLVIHNRRIRGSAVQTTPRVIR